MKIIKKKYIAEMQLDWVNNFSTISRFSEYYNIYEKSALKIINYK